MQARSLTSLLECERRSMLYSLKMISFVIEAAGELPIATEVQAMMILEELSVDDGPKKLFVFIRPSSQQGIPEKGRQEEAMSISNRDGNEIARKLKNLNNLVLH